MEKTVPFDKNTIQNLKTPFHIYDETAIINNAKRLLKAFEWANFKEYFAVKANPNPHILKILKEIGFGTDCSSLPELILSEKVGITGENIMFTSNDTPAEEFVKAKELGAIINLDDISHIEFLEKSAGIPDLISFRFNPGPDRSGNALIGDPKEAKYGFTRDQLFEGYKVLKEKGVKRFGLHTMVISNELNKDSFIQTAKMLFELVVEIKEKLDITIEFVNLGGGIGIPMKPDESEVDIEYVSSEIKKLYDQMNLSGLKIFLESGRWITGPS